MLATNIIDGHSLSDKAVQQKKTKIMLYEPCIHFTVKGFIASCMYVRTLSTRWSALVTYIYKWACHLAWVAKVLQL